MVIAATKVCCIRRKRNTHKRKRDRLCHIRRAEKGVAQDKERVAKREPLRERRQPRERCAWRRKIERKEQNVATFERDH